MNKFSVEMEKRSRHHQRGGSFEEHLWDKLDHIKQYNKHGHDKLQAVR
jgi:hypothetical protein